MLSNKNLTEISFNPIAKSFMIKSLTKIIETEYTNHKSGSSCFSKKFIEDIAVSSGGDIRSAINNIQFSFRTNPKKTGKNIN